jgi:RNA-binding protein (KH domain)
LLRKRWDITSLPLFRRLFGGYVMKDLLYAIAAGLVEDKSAIKIVEDEPDAEGVIVFHLSVAPNDMGRVIGKQGRIAKALRTIMRAGAAKKDLKVSVTIE